MRASTCRVSHECEDSLSNRFCFGVLQILVGNSDTYTYEHHPCRKGEQQFWCCNMSRFLLIARILSLDWSSEFGISATYRNILWHLLSCRLDMQQTRFRGTIERYHSPVGLNEILCIMPTGRRGRLVHHPSSRSTIDQRKRSKEKHVDLKRTFLKLVLDEEQSYACRVDESSYCCIW